MRPPVSCVRPPAQRRITETDAIDIWIARWLRIGRKHLIERYGCDPRRLYEVSEGKRFAGSREKALERFVEEYPGLAERVDFGLHRRIPRAPPLVGQLELFETGDQARRGAPRSPTMGKS
jgi:hypothetical protein